MSFNQNFWAESCLLHRAHKEKHWEKMNEKPTLGPHQGGPWLLGQKFGFASLDNGNH